MYNEVLYKTQVYQNKMSSSQFIRYSSIVAFDLLLVIVVKLFAMLFFTMLIKIFQFTKWVEVSYLVVDLLSSLVVVGRLYHTAVVEQPFVVS